MRRQKDEGEKGKAQASSTSAARTNASCFLHPSNFFLQCSPGGADLYHNSGEM
jgi:hypothetical protein